VDRGIGSWVTRRAALDGDDVALIEGGTRTTWAEFEERTNRLGHALMTLGVRRGDRIAVLMFNSVTFMETVFAVAKLGAIVVPVNFRLQGPEVAYILADAGADVLVHHDALAVVARTATADPAVRVRHRIEVVAPAGAPRSPAPVPDGPDAALGYEHLMAAATTDPLDMDVDPSQPHGIMYTSGTTGRPKGAVLTHANAVANARNGLTQGRGVHQGDVTVTAAPLFHIGGLGVHSLPFVYVGATNVIVPSFDPPAFLEAMATHRATVQFLVPAMWAALTRVPDFDRFDLGALEMAVSGGAPTPLPVIEFFDARGVTFQEGFGMTETAPSVSVLDAAHIRSKAGSIGRPLQDVETRVVDEDDRDVGVDAVGELLVRGDNVFAGYWMLPAATAEAFRGGWFHTGDLARVDPDGYITLVDRKKDMIITGGENVYPIEVEQVMFRHPAIREAAVFGVADERWGETVIAAVALDDAATAEDIIGYCRARLAHFKCPTRVEVVDELPRNATGKVLKTALRATYGSTAAAVSR
jgi:fatty-acyl-CoA synthase